MRPSYKLLLNHHLCQSRQSGISNVNIVCAYLLTIKIRLNLFFHIKKQIGARVGVGVVAAAHAEGVSVNIHKLYGNREFLISPSDQTCQSDSKLSKPFLF